VQWSIQQSSFAIETFFRNNESIVATQHAIRTRFGLPPRVVVLNRRRSILKWVKDFREHSNVVPKIPRRVPYTVTPKNKVRVQVSDGLELLN